MTYSKYFSIYGACPATKCVLYILPLLCNVSMKSV